MAEWGGKREEEGRTTTRTTTPLLNPILVPAAARAGYGENVSMKAIELITARSPAGSPQHAADLAALSAPLTSAVAAPGEMLSLLGGKGLPDALSQVRSGGLTLKLLATSYGRELAQQLADSPAHGFDIEHAASLVLGYRNIHTHRLPNFALLTDQMVTLGVVLELEEGVHALIPLKPEEPVIFFVP